MTLASATFEVQILDGVPGITGYRALPDGPCLSGGAPCSVLLLDTSTGRYLEEATLAAAPEGDSAVVTAKVGEAQAGSFRLRFALEGNTLSISSEILAETAPYQIASVYLELFRVAAGEPGAALVLPTRSGRLVEMAHAKPERAVHKVDWFEPVPVAMAGNDKMFGVLTLDTVDSQIVHEVKDGAGCITVELLHRHRVDKPELSFIAQKLASCKVRLVATAAGGKVDWTDGAALVRDTIAPNLSELYTGALIYKVMLQVAGEDKAMTYADVLDLIRRVNRLTGGSRQIVYLVGWQHGGHDTGYPDVFTANPRVGTFAEFRALKDAAKAENALVSVHDNYHDTYMDSAAWDPSIVCIQPTGELRKGGIWGGGRQAYEIGPSKYAPRCVDRARWTVETLGLEQTTHLDVLSDKPDMVDFDPAGPASREQNAKAKRAIVETFRSMGVDVTSEVLTSPFAPWMHHFWHVERRPVEGWGPHERIPLVPFLYHGKVTAGGDASTDEAKLDQIEYGWTFSIDWSDETTDEEIMDLYYLVWMPWSLTATREITGFERDGEWEKVVYSADTFARVNRPANTYEVVVDGNLIAKDFATFAPAGEGSWAVYSRGGGSVQLPDSAAEAEINPLLDSPIPQVEQCAQGLCFESQPRIPYRVTRRAAGETV